MATTLCLLHKILRTRNHVDLRKVYLMIILSQIFDKYPIRRCVTFVHVSALEYALYTQDVTLIEVIEL